MVQEEKLEKICNDFTKLNEEQQDYILGIMQALAFANNTGKRSDHKEIEKDVLNYPMDHV